ncbi:MAG: hypothetical protein ACLSAF_22005 [Intestinimonas sp.]
MKAIAEAAGPTACAGSAPHALALSAGMHPCGARCTRPDGAPRRCPEKGWCIFIEALAVTWPKQERYLHKPLLWIEDCRMPGLPDPGVRPADPGGVTNERHIFD